MAVAAVVLYLYIYAEGGMDARVAIFVCVKLIHVCARCVCIMRNYLEMSESMLCKRVRQLDFFLYKTELLLD